MCVPQPIAVSMAALYHMCPSNKERPEEYDLTYYLGKVKWDLEIW